MSRASLDWNDRAAVARWLAGLRTSFADLDAVAIDMLRPPHERELGPVLHAKNYGAARLQIWRALDFALPPDPEGGAPSAVVH